MKKHLLLLATSLICIALQAQNVGIGNSDPKAKLDVTATNEGILIPRVALTATNSASPLTTPETSELVYNTATAGTAPNNVTPGYYYWDGAKWVRVANSNEQNWTKENTTATTAVKTDNQYVTGNVGLGDFSATDIVHKLHIVETGNDAAISGLYVNETNIGQAVTIDEAGNGQALLINESGNGTGILLTANDNGSAIISTAQGAVTTNAVGHDLYDNRTSSSASVTKIGARITSTGTWNGAGAINTGLDVNVSGGTTNYAALFNGGNVGIGISLPSSLLHVNVPSGNDIALKVHGGGSGVGIAEFRRTIGPESVTTIHASGGDPQIRFDRNVVTANTASWAVGSFGVPASNQFRIAGNNDIGTNDYLVIRRDNGHVGIGNTNPGFILDVSDRIRLRSNGANTAGLWLNNSGNTNVISFFGTIDDNRIGIYNVGLNNWGLQMNRTSGAVGIGSILTNYRLNVDGAVSLGESDIYFTKTNHNHTGWGNVDGFAAIENAEDYGTLMILGRRIVSSTRRVSIYDQLSVGNNTFQGSAALSVAGSIRAAGGAPGSNNSTNGYSFDGDGDTGMFVRGGSSPTFNHLSLYRNNTERVRIDQDGNNYTSVSWTTMSDKRFKTNVEPIHNSLSKIINLNGVYYNYIENDRFEFPKGKTIGFIAQEVEKILPELVSIDEDGYRGVKYELVTAVLVEAIKEQQTLIETLQKNNTEKDIQFNKLTTEVEELKSLKKELAEIKNLLKDQQFKAVK